MATSCPSFLRGNVMRATRLNACGQPVYGEGNQVVSDGFVTISMSPEVQEGEEVTVTKANGRTCISDKACDQLRWYTIETEFCQVDPDLVQMMNPTWEKILDYQGNTIGYDAKGNLSCDTGFALEVWMDTYGASDACSGESAQGAWGYLLLPWVVGGAPGDLEIGNDAISFTFSGRTKMGSRWRKGPYPVMLGESAIPGPLLTPVTDQTQYRLFVTTIRPPEPDCGAQPVDRPTPEQADLVVTGVAGESPRRTVRMRVDNHGFGPVTINWGDNTAPQVSADGAYVSHTYAADGDYTITVADQETPAITVVRDITVPLAADEPTVRLTADDPQNRMAVTADITLPEQSSGEATVDWGDGSDLQTVTVSGSGTVAATHTYAANGVYTVSVRRADVETFRVRAAIAVPVPAGPVLSIARDTSDATGKTASLTWNNATNGVVSIDWGEGGALQDGAATGTASHAYAVDGPHTITVTSKVNPAASTDAAFTTPLPVNMTVAAAKAASDATGKTVAVTVANQSEGAVTIKWGDNTPDSTNAGDGTAITNHVYATNGSKTITVTDSSNPQRVGTASFAIPFA